MSSRRYSTVSEATSVAGLLLSGGQSRRMGEDKALLTLPGGRSLLQHGLERLCGSLSRVAISGSPDCYSATEDVPVLPDPDAFPDSGPLAGVLAGLYWASSIDRRWLLTLPVDLPLLPMRWVRRALQVRRENVALYLSYLKEGEKSLDAPLAAIWPTSLIDEIEAGLAAGQRSVMEFHHQHKSHHLDVSALRRPSRLTQSSDGFLNLNTPKDRAILDALWDCGEG